LVLRNAPDDNGTDRHRRRGWRRTVEFLFDHFNDFSAQNATGQPDFIERGIVRLLDGLYLDVSGSTSS